MPLPVPEKGEKKSDFISRCMGNDMMLKDFPDQKQRAAVCYSQEKKRMSDNVKIQSAVFAPSPVYYQKFEGKEYLVAPVIALRVGVFNGALHTPEELEDSVPSWNGRPLVLYHPKVGEIFVSANSPEILEKFSIGFFFNAFYDANEEALKGEIWVDMEKAKALGEDGTEVLNRLQMGMPLEVSTGYFSDDEPHMGADLFDGKKYEAIRRDILPDHLAVLPRATGACSVRDGCGAPRVHEKSLSDAQSDVQNNESGNVTVQKIISELERIYKLLQEGLSNPITKMYKNTEEEDVATEEKCLCSEKESSPTANNEETLDLTVQKQETETTNKEQDMSKVVDLVDQLLSEENAVFSDEDRSQLEALSENLLEKLVAYQPTTANTEITEPEPAANDEAELEEVADEPQPEVQEAEESPDSVQKAEISVREETNPIVELAAKYGFTPREAEECLKTHMEAQRTRRKNLIETIVTNSEFTKDELADEPVERLEKIAKVVKAQEPLPDYSGKGGIAPRPKEETNAVPPPPPVVMAEPKTNKEVN